MMQLFQSFPPSEIAAILSIIAVLLGALAWLVRVAADRRYLRRATFYAQRDDDDAADSKKADDEKEFREAVLGQLKQLEEQVAKITRDQEASKAPIEQLTDAVREMVKGLAQFQRETADWRTKVEARVAVVEDRQVRNRRG